MSGLLLLAYLQHTLPSCKLRLHVYWNILELIKHRESNQNNHNRQQLKIVNQQSWFWRFLNVLNAIDTSYILFYANDTPLLIG